MKKLFRLLTIVTGLLLGLPIAFMAAQEADACREVPVRSEASATAQTPADESSVEPTEMFAQRGDPGTRQRNGWFRGRWRRGSTESQKNDSKVKSAYKQSSQSAVKATGQIFVDGKPVALATAVDSDGYLVSKASLLNEEKKLTCQFPGHESVDVALVGVDEDYDLALLKVDDLVLTPATWRTETAGPGTLVAAVDQEGSVISVGVVSTEPRRIRGTKTPRRAWLGVSLGGGEARTGITEVLNGGAAKRAGLKAGDRIKAIDGMEMKSMEAIISAIGNHFPGDELAIMFQREGEVLEISVKLGRPPSDIDPQDHWGGGPFSARREGFPSVLTHDTIIRPEQCGGPLVDTNGQIVGVNIARALRVTSYAIPAETVQRLVKELKKS